MDVEKRTTIVAGMNAEPMKQGLREIAAEVQKTTTQMTQSTGQMSRSLLDTSRGFDMLQRKWVEGYKDAMTYLQAFQTLTNAQKNGRDAMGNYEAILGALGKQFGIVGTAAQEAATRMLTAGKNVDQYKAGLQDLIRVMQLASRAPPPAAVDYGAVIARTTGMAGDPAKSAAESAAVMAAAFDKQRAAIDPLFRVSKEYEAAMAAVDEQVANYNITAQQGAAIQAQLTAAFQKANAPLIEQSETYDQLRRKIDPVYAASKKYEDELNALNEIGTKLNLTFAQKVALEEQLTAKYAAANQPLIQQAESYEKQRSKIDSVYRVSMQYAAEQENITAVSKQLNLSQAQTDALLAQSTQRFAAANAPLGLYGQTINHLTGATGQQQFAMRQLGVQAIQTFQGIATGQPILMTLIQQGHQVADVMISSGTSVKDLGAAFANFFRSIPTGAYVAVGLLAIGAALAYITAKAEEAARATKQLQNQVDAARGAGTGVAASAQAEQAARDLAVESELGHQEALAAGHAIETNRYWAGTTQQLKGVILVAEQMRRSFGTDLQTEIQKLSAAMQDPGKAAEESAKQVSTFTTQVVQHIQNLQQAGKLSEAWNLFFETMQKGTQNAINNLTPLEAAWQHFSELATGDKSKSAWTSLGEHIAGVLAEIIDAFSRAVEWERKFLHPVEAADWANIPFTRLWWQKVLGLGGEPGAVGGAGGGVPDVTEWMKTMLRAPGAAPTGVSTAGALGIMQLMPKTAEGLGVNPFIPSENVKGGLQYLQDLFRNQGQGDIERTLGMYNMGPGGYTKAGAAGYVAKIQAADIGTLPKDTVTMIDYWGQKLGLPPELIAFGKRIAVVESGGEQLGARTPYKIAPSDVGAVTSAGTTAAAAATGASQAGAIDPDKVAADQLKENLQKHANMIALMREANLREQQKNNADIIMAQKQLAADPSNKQLQANLAGLQESARHLTSDYTNLITEQEKLARSMNDANKVLTAHVGAAREAAEIEQRYSELARDTNGNIVDQTAKLAALNALDVKHAAALHDMVVALQEATNAELRQTKAIEQGGMVAEHAANLEKARADQLANYDPATQSKQYADAVALETLMLDRNSEAKRTNAAASMIQQLGQENEQLQLEAKLIGASTAEINRQTAALRARQALGLKPGETPNVEQQKAIDMAKQTADLKTEVEKQKAIYQELESFGTNVFDTIGNAMEASFQKGADAGKIWQDAIGNIMNEVIKEFMKLAIVNPLLNSLFGGGRPELGDIGGGSGGGGLLGSLLGGGSGGDGQDDVSRRLAGLGPSGSGGGGGGLGGSGGLIGSLVNSIGGKGFYQGGGLIGSLFGSGGGAGEAAGAAGSLDAMLPTSLPGLYHSGGLVGLDGVAHRLVPASDFHYAPHFQSGFGNDEFAAILHRSERVLTANQNDRMERVMNRVASGDHGGRGGGGNVVFNIQTPDADSFKSSQPQIAARAVAGLNRAQQRNRT